MEKIKPYIPLIVLCISIAGVLFGAYSQVQLNTETIKELKKQQEKLSAEMLQYYCPKYQCDYLDEKIRNNTENIKDRRHNGNGKAH